MHRKRVTIQYEINSRMATITEHTSKFIQGDWKHHRMTSVTSVYCFICFVPSPNFIHLIKNNVTMYIYIVYLVVETANTDVCVKTFSRRYDAERYNQRRNIIKVRFAVKKETLQKFHQKHSNRCKTVDECDDDFNVLI